jgi:hypothetical protein
VKGKEVVVGFVVDGVNGRTLGFEVLFEGDGRAFRRWLEPYAIELGAAVLISNDNDFYSVAAAELAVTKRANSILEQASKGWHEQDHRLQKLEEDLRELRGCSRSFLRKAAEGSGGCIEDTCGLLHPQGKTRRPSNLRRLTG